MCGFVSVYSKDGHPINQNELERMTNIITHRGPDDMGTHIDHPVGLGFRRLSIIDLEDGKQPLSNETNDIWITFNGEIYNYQELRKWLIDRGHHFKTQSDTETIIHLYEEKGMDCVNDLRGMFGFVIWDQRNQILFGARDHFGIKPVYWVETKDSYGFASELKSLLELGGVEREVNQTSFLHYLTFQYVPDPSTMFSSIHKVPPGHRFYIKNNQLTVESYWKPEFKPEEDKPFSYFVDKTRAAVEESVKAHRVSDVQRGAFLSSGVDSSTIVGLLSKYEEVKTYSVGFNIPGYSELDYARRTAKYCGTDHHEVEIDSKEYLENLPKLIWHQEDPVADPSAIALYFVARLASQDVKVVLSGEGADEFFGGYNIYREPSSLRLFSYLPKRARQLIGHTAKWLPSGLKGRNYLIRGSKDLEERFYGNAFIFSEALKQQLVPYSLDSRTGYIPPWEITHPIYREVTHLDDETKMQYLDMNTWLCGNILMKADKMTMANSLELRVPFIDRYVFDVASTIPTKYKIANGTTKFVLREAMKDILPPEIQTRRKLGFPVPIRHWLRNDFYLWAKAMIHDSPVEEFIHKPFVLNLLEEHRSGKADYSRNIWTVLNFILWHQLYIQPGQVALPSSNTQII